MRPSWAKHSSVGRHWGLITLGQRGGRQTARIIHSLPSDTLSTVYPMLTGCNSTLWGGCVCACVSVSLCMHLRGDVTNLRPDEGLKAGLEVVNAAVVELGHLIQQLLVFGLKVFPDRSELLSGLGCGVGWGDIRRGHQRSLSVVT